MLVVSKALSTWPGVSVSVVFKSRVEVKMVQGENVKQFSPPPSVL